MFHGLRGPNITVSNKHFSGESAMIQAASLLRHGQADVAIVLAGDALARTLYSWYEEANLLSPACYNLDPVRDVDGFIPSEGVAALVMEAGGAFHEARPGKRSLAAMISGRWAGGGRPAEIIGQMLGGSQPSLILCSGDGGPCATSPTDALAREIAGDRAAIIPPNAFALGLAGTGALFHLILGLSSRPASGQALLLGTARDSGFAAILLELPER